MSDRIPAEIWIGGKNPASLVPDLCAAIAVESVSLEWGGARFCPTTSDDLVDALDQDADGGPLLWLCDDEASCGEFDMLETFLEEHGIPFTRQSDGRYEYEPERVEFRPGMEKVWLATDRSGETVVPAALPTNLEAALTKVLQHAEAGRFKRVATSLRSALKKLRQSLPPSIPPLPPFEIVATGKRRASK